jgi:hypothetical protein
MAIDKRHKNGRWDLPTNEANGAIESWDHVKIAVLMDIRDELQELNRTFNCPNFRMMPRQLELTRRAIEGLRRDLKRKQ